MQRERKLTNCLIAKTTAEILFVVALAAYFSYADFTPGLRGWLDVANEREVSGWAVDQNEPDSHVEVQLYINDRFIASQFADYLRPDVQHAGYAADERHGYRFETPALHAGEYEARIYALRTSRGGARRTLQTIGNPSRFTIVDATRT